MQFDIHDAGCGDSSPPASLIFRRLPHDRHRHPGLNRPKSARAQAVLASIALSCGLVLTGCASERMRDPVMDKMIFASVISNQPNDADAPRPLGSFRLAAWQRDLDSDDPRAYARAVSGLRNNLVAYLPEIASDRLPTKPRGRQAVAQLIREGFTTGAIESDALPEPLVAVIVKLCHPYMTPDVPAPTLGPTAEQLRALLAEPRHVISEPEIAARMAAISLASELPEATRANLMHWMLFDRLRQARYAASAFFRRYPRFLTVETLTQLLESVRTGHRELRADSAQLLTAIESRLEVRVPGAPNVRRTLDPHAPSQVRLSQIAVWEAWLANVEPALARLRANITVPGDESDLDGD